MDERDEELQRLRRELAAAEERASRALNLAIERGGTVARLLDALWDHRSAFRMGLAPAPEQAQAANERLWAVYDAEVARGRAERE